MYRFLADAVVVIHLAFVLFAVAGGLLVLKWRRILWIHLLAAVTAVLAELTGWICPLTHLENWFREKGGSVSYSESFVEHYIVPVLYPERLTRSVQIVLGTFVITVNLIVYLFVIKTWNRRVRDTSVGDQDLKSE